MIDVGISAFALQHTPESIKYFREAIDLGRHPSVKKKFEVVVHKNLALALHMAGDHKGAAEHYTLAHQYFQQALAGLIPKPPICFEGLALVARVVIPKCYESMAELQTVRDRFEAHIEAFEGVFDRVPVHRQCQVSVPHFNLCYGGFNDKRINAKVAKMFRTAIPALAWTLHRDDPNAPPHGAANTPKKLRVGFLISKEDHTVGRLFGPLMARLRNPQIEVVYISFQPGASVYGSMVDRHIAFNQGGETSFEEARGRIADAKLDVLVYSELGMEITPYFLSFGRLAPVQVATWGHPVTSGVETVDYFVAPQIEIPTVILTSHTHYPAATWQGWHVLRSCVCCGGCVCA